MKPNQIKAALAERGIRQREIARECSVTDTQVSRVIKQCDFVVSTKVARAIAKRLGMPLERVFPAYTSSSQSLRESGHSRARAAA